MSNKKGFFGGCECIDERVIWGLIIVFIIACCCGNNKHDC